MIPKNPERVCGDLPMRSATRAITAGEKIADWRIVELRLRQFFNVADSLTQLTGTTVRES